MGGTFRRNNGSLDVGTLLQDAYDFLGTDSTREYVVSGLNKCEVGGVLSQLNSDAYQARLSKEADTRTDRAELRLTITGR